MENLFNFDMDTTMMVLSTLKEEYDSGFDAFKDVFGSYSLDFEDIEGEYYEHLYNVAELARCITLCYPNENGQIDDYSEPYGERWFFASEDMTEFYRLSKKICRLKKIRYNDEKSPQYEMYHFVRERLLHFTYGISFNLRDKTNHKYASSLTMWQYYDASAPILQISLAISGIFQNYSKKLLELKEEYKELTSNPINYETEKAA